MIVDTVSFVLFFEKGMTDIMQDKPKNKTQRHKGTEKPIFYNEKKPFFSEKEEHMKNLLNDIKKGERATCCIKTNTGFTLVELLIVIMIIGILAAIAVPMFLGERTKAVQTEAKTNLESLRLLEEQFFAENGSYTADLGTCAKDNDNIAIIRAVLPGFQPGNDLKFSYCVEADKDIDGANQTPCFRARAFGNSTTAVDGVEFAIDCNNNRTF